MNKFKFILKYCKAWFIVSLAVILVFFAATMVATQNDFIAGTLDTVLGGESRKIVSGNPNEYMRYDKSTDEFRQFESDLELSSNVLSTRADKEAVHAEALRLNEEIVGEGVVLLKNENDALPIATSNSAKAKISVFGKNSANVVLGGSGSGGGNSAGSVSLYDGLRNAGFELNPQLTKFYESSSSGKGRDANPAIEGGALTGFRTGETPYESYPANVTGSYSDYDDAAVIVLSRIGGEGFDLPRTMVTSYGGAPVEGAKEGQHYLELDANEERLIEEVTSCGKFERVVVLINCATSMELGFIEDNEDIDAALWIGSLGGSGANAVGRVLSGDINPSGHLVDTYARDFTKDPTWQNFSDNLKENGNTYTMGGATSDYHYVEYEEGIYLGYRYYETRSYQDVYRFGTDYGWYEENVVYPFGYGLSYTQFQWTLKDHSDNSVPLSKEGNNTISVTVNVKNIGDVAGKDVLELYYSAPYISGGIEKSTVVLGGMAKTDLLQPGEDRDYTITLDIEDMASYDYNDANGNGNIGYELDAGLYTIYVGTDAHTSWADEDGISVDYTVESDITYPMDIYGTGSANDNRFQDMSDYMEGKTMSRASFASTMPSTPTQAENEMAETVREALTFKYDDENGEYVDFLKSLDFSAVADGEVPQLYDLIGVDYDDPRWSEIVNSLSVDTLCRLIGQGNFHTISISEISKPRTLDPDGPAGFTNFMGDPSVHDTCFYCSECVIGATWNVDLAHDMGVMVGLESIVGYTNMDGTPYSGWYAPAVNIHRSPFSGRNWEYYSEDPFLSGSMGANVVIGAQSKGVYTYVKHFVLNDQETNRDTNGLFTWADEQTFREIYLKPFRMIVEDGDTHAMMTSFNRIGATWAGGSFALLTEVLRMEWGFTGMVITDYNLSVPYMPPDQMIRVGGDLNLSQDYKPSASVSGDGKTQEMQEIALKQAAKNILYTVANSNAMNGYGVGVVWAPKMAVWRVGLICANVGLVVLAAVWGFFEIRRKKKKYPDAWAGTVSATSDNNKGDVAEQKNRIIW